MDSQLVQRTRYQLQARVRSAKTCPVPLFGMTCGHLLDWVYEHPLLRGLLAPLRPSIDSYAIRINENVAKAGTKEHSTITGHWKPTSREDGVALATAALSCARDLPLGQDNLKAYVVAFAAAAYSPGPHKNAVSADIVEAMRDVCVQALYDFLDEGIDARNAVLGLLVKYKHRCEMYRRHRLRDGATNGIEGRRGEKALAFDLYEYLHDQGVDFWIESKSASGEPDLVSRDAGGQRLVADAKYIRDGLQRSKVIKTVASGFRQVLDYCRDHDEPVGYLVVFVDRDVVIDLKAERDDGFPCFRTGGYAVYYVIVDIFAHSDTASARPKPEVIEITREQLMASWDGPEGDAGASEEG